MKDNLQEIHSGLGKKPATTKTIRTGWCGFCRKPVPLKRTPGVGYLCPDCGGRVLGNSPGISRNIYTV